MLALSGISACTWQYCYKKIRFYSIPIALGLASMSPQFATAAPANTNKCIIDLGGIQVCQQILGGSTWDALGTLIGAAVVSNPSYNACCAGIFTMAKDMCEANPAISAILTNSDPNGLAIYGLEAACRLNVFTGGQFLSIPTRDIRKGNLDLTNNYNWNKIKTNNYGCAVQATWGAPRSLDNQT